MYIYILWKIIDIYRKLPKKIELYRIYGNVLKCIEKYIEKWKYIEKYWDSGVGWNLGARYGILSKQ